MKIAIKPSVEEQVQRFIHWVSSCDSGSLTGNSRVAIDAQKRVMRQLDEYLEGIRENRNWGVVNYVDFAWWQKTMNEEKAKHEKH